MKSMENRLNTTNKRTSLKKAILYTSIFVIPLTTFLVALMLPSLSDDIDTRVLQNEIFGFFVLGLFIVLVIIVVIIDLVINLVRKTDKYTFKTIFGAIGVALILSTLAFGFYKRSEAAYKDYFSEDLYIVGRVEMVKPENDGIGPFVIIENDRNEYILSPAYIELRKGSVYKFKYYKYSNIVYMIEEIEG